MALLSHIELRNSTRRVRSVQDKVMRGHERASKGAILVGLGRTKRESECGRWWEMRWFVLGGGCFWGSPAMPHPALDRCLFSGPSQLWVSLPQSATLALSKLISFARWLFDHRATWTSVHLRVRWENRGERVAIRGMVVMRSAMQDAIHS
jgi:hypothetical protein